MKIIHILQSTRFSGAENVVCQIIKMFENEQNYEMLYVSPKGTIEETLAEINICHHGIDSLSISNVRQLIRKYKPDIIHAHDVSASIVAGIATIGTSCKVISHMHVNHENMSKLNIKTLLYFISSIRYKKIFWVSQSAYEHYFFKEYIKNKSTVLYNVMNKKDIIEKKNKDVNEYDFDICYVGRLTYQKNPERLIEVLRIACDRKKDLKVAIVGNGDLFEKTQEDVINVGLEQNIKFLGFMNNPLKVMSNSKVMIMTSRYEGLPMSVLESMALGVPVVSTPVDGLLDVVDNGINGFLNDDNKQLAECILKLVMDDSYRKEMSDNAIIRFEELMDLNKYKQEIERSYLL